MMSAALFPFTIYNGMVAYQYDGYRYGPQILQDLPFDYWITTHGFVPPSHPHAISLLSDCNSVPTTERMNRVSYSLILPTGQLFTGDENQNTLIALPMKKGVFILGQAQAHEQFVMGSLAVTKDLHETAKVFRMAFDINTARIVVEPLNNFLLKVKRGVDKKIKDGYPVHWPSAATLLHQK